MDIQTIEEAKQLPIGALIKDKRGRTYLVVGPGHIDKDRAVLLW